MHTQTRLCKFLIYVITCFYIFLQLAWSPHEKKLYLCTMKRILIIILSMMIAAGLTYAQYWSLVDPRIGSVGVGRTFPGPSMPFGMVKPGPDCGVLPNAGWAPMPERVSGFSQTHVSGTGGGQKYGNILVQPILLDKMPAAVAMGRRTEDFAQSRMKEVIALGYYGTTYENGVSTEITTSERCAHYRFHFPRQQGALLVDATHFLGKDSIPNLRERQQFVGAALKVESPYELTGYSSVRGGWNNGDAYTVFFCLLADQPFAEHTDENGQRALLCFADTLVGVKIGLSYVSTEQARMNMDSRDFDSCLQALRLAWDQQFRKIQITGSIPQQRMFYSALYHTMLMPVDKTGENSRWKDTPYYDDYYAIWDTYRTSSPLLTLLWPERQAAMVNALLNIYNNEGYMPDARSGDCNGRTQGGSNAEVVIADAFAKGLEGIDYELALEAMLKDGEVDPGDDHEKHGRGGLTEYKQLGYVPYGIPRAGTRTVEYSYNDFCLAQVAQGLLDRGGTLLDEARRKELKAIHDQYMSRSGNWKNLWRKDYEWDNVRGYILPKDADGHWLDSVTWGRSLVFHPRIAYTPVTKVAPWHLPWWDTFFYEALSAEYSLSIPHDVPGLIRACGGPEAFRTRLDLFFERGRYNVGNEPSFLTPCLYHWLGRPDLSSLRIHQIIRDNYSDQPDGLPGNDDSGAMSSWLAFHMMGLYPNAGQDYYLLNVPLLSEFSFSLSNGRTLHVSKRGAVPVAGMDEGFVKALFNGRELTDARITHQELMEGGELVFVTKPVAALPQVDKQVSATVQVQNLQDVTLLTAPKEAASGSVFFTLNRQFRTWPVNFTWEADTLVVKCRQTLYRIPRDQAEHAKGFCWNHPQSDGTIYDNVNGTFLFISADAMRQLRQEGSFVYDGITWRRQADGHVKADADGTEMWLKEVNGLGLVMEMRHNPLGIDWALTVD